MSKSTAHPNVSHKYLRIRVKGKDSVTKYRWRCVRPGCGHWLHQDFIIGAVSECWRCGSDFTIEKATALKKPHCRNCTRRKFEEPELPIVPESPI